MSDSRPDPDALLASISETVATGHRGKLKIFLGMSPGVGKTYTMLEAARQKAVEGLDVVAGYVEPHARPETEAILLGLEVLPRRRVDYRGVVLEEFDLEAALRRNPQLILVDELAHTNAPGSRHAKRHQDVEELLSRGIDVYSTLNVQHLDSFNDVVARITGIVVRETVPDGVFDRADDVELVDLPPDDLLGRLREGRVYIPEQARQATEGFFRRENLIALRELALRVVADRVNAQVQVQHAGKGATEPWATNERLLVCVGPSPLSARVIRTARRMVTAQRAHWTAVAVETPRLSRKALLQIRRNLRLAEQLGAETVVLSGEGIVDEVLAYATRTNITRIVIGKPTLPRLREWLRGSIIDEMIRRSGDIDIHVVKGESDDSEAGADKPERRSHAWRGYAEAVAILTACTLGAALLFPYFSPPNLAMVYLAGVVFVALRQGTGPSISASILAPVLFNFFFTSPYYSLAIADAQYVLTFLVLFGVSLLISGLSGRVRRQTEAARTRYMRVAALYFMSRTMATSADAASMSRFAARHLSDVFGCPAAVLLPGANGAISLAACHGGSMDESPHDRAAAQWTLENRKWAGKGTDTLPACDALFVPLVAGDRPIGVLSLRLSDGSVMEDPDQQHLLETFASQISLALERASLAEQAQAARISMETERLRNTLLSSVSHDLRTPLATIAGASSILADEKSSLQEPARRELARSILNESNRLNRLVGNLLDITRFESGEVRIQREWTPIEEVIGAVLRKLRETCGTHSIVPHLPPGLPLVPIDSLLIQQVLLNLLDNAMKYAAASSQIDLCVEHTSEGILVEVADRGPGMTKEECRRVFEKFYRSVKKSPAGGVGLGLTICQAMIRAHGGRIWAENRAGGGASLRFLLPILGQPPTQPPGEPPLAQPDSSLKV